MIQIEMMKLLGVVLFVNYYTTIIPTINMEMQFGDSFQVNGSLGGYQVYKEKIHQFFQTSHLKFPILNSLPADQRSNL